MRTWSTFVALGVLTLNLLLGWRGLWVEDKNFFTMHPFSDPLVHCTIQGSTEGGGNPDEIFLPALYRTMLGGSYTNRFYLELLPHYERGLTEAVRQQLPDAQVRIPCVSVHDDPPVSYPRPLP